MTILAKPPNFVVVVELLVIPVQLIFLDGGDADGLQCLPVFMALCTVVRKIIKGYPLFARAAILLTVDDLSVAAFPLRFRQYLFHGQLLLTYAALSSRLFGSAFVFRWALFFILLGGS